MAKKIIVAEDNGVFRKVIKTYLVNRSFSVLETDNGADALTLARESQPDLVLSDANIPGLNGHALCRVLRQEAAVQSVPVILMSGALIEEKNVLAGLEDGADDYLLKPFSMPVLAAKIQAVLRRYESSSTCNAMLTKRGIQLDPAGRRIFIDGKPLTLTRKEFDLLALLLNKPDRVLTTAYLLETVWGYDLADYNDPSTVEVHISHLRKKLGPRLAKNIVNLKGVGYKFERPANSI